MKLIYLPLHQFTEKDTQAPYVYREAVATCHAYNDFRSRVAQSAAVCGCSKLVLGREDFGKAKINKFDVAFFIYHAIFRFDIPVYDIISL